MINFTFTFVAVLAAGIAIMPKPYQGTMLMALVLGQALDAIAFGIRAWRRHQVELAIAQEYFGRDAAKDVQTDLLIAKILAEEERGESRE